MSNQLRDAVVRVPASVEAFDQWAAKDQSRRDRDQFVALMLREGRTLQEIADAFGITRERVRQLAKRAGEKTRSHKFRDVDFRRLLSAIRKPTTHDIRGLAVALGEPDHVAIKELRVTGLRAAAVRLFRWRRSAPTRKRIAVGIRAEAARLGRTPTLHELSVVFGWPLTRAGTELGRVFGSTRAAMEYCDLQPRGVGGKGHITPRGPSTHCRRGHEFTEANTYRFIDRSNGKEHRQCRACKDASRKAKRAA